MPLLVVAALFSLLVGAVLGLLGGGGGILAVPVLVYGLGVGPRSAIAVSLFFVGATSLVGAGLHARARRVRWKIGAIFGAASMAGAFAGGRLARFVPEALLLGSLAIVMLVTAIGMFRGRAEPSTPRHLAHARVLAIGALVGVVSGLVGVGGGFLVVPALTLFGGLATREAIGTSLFVIALQSFAGFAGHVGHAPIDARLVTVMTGAAVVGMASGASLGERVPTAALERAFAALVFTTGLFILGQQLPLLGTAIVAVIALGIAARGRIVRARSGLGVRWLSSPREAPRPHDEP